MSQLQYLSSAVAVLQTDSRTQSYAGQVNLWTQSHARQLEPCTTTWYAETEGPYSTRLLGCCEFPIAIVHCYNTARLLALDYLHCHVNLSYVQGRPQSISTRPLDEGHLRLCTKCTSQIRTSVPKRAICAYIEGGTCCPDVESIIGHGFSTG